MNCERCKKDSLFLWTYRPKDRPGRFKVCVKCSELLEGSPPTMKIGFDGCGNMFIIFSDRVMSSFPERAMKDIQDGTAKILDKRGVMEKV